MSSMFGGGFKASKCKTLLRLAMARIKLLRNKRDIQIKQMRKDIAQLLSTGQEPSARIRVEHIAREQNIMAAYDIIELFCELIIVRLPIIESQKVCPMDLKEAVSSLIFASPRCADLPELLQIRGLFSSKYGKEFVASAAELRPECGVNRRIIEKLSVRAPSGETKLKLLTEIAAEHNVSWDPADTEAELMKQPEDLLDGPKKFFGASQAPIPEVQPSPPKPVEPVSHPQKTSSVPQQGPAAPSPLAPPVTSSESEEDTPADEKRQFIPFVGPLPTKGVPPAKNSHSSSKGNSSGKFESTVSSSKGDPNARARKEGQMGYEKHGDYDNVAAAAKAAAQNADRAVSAARAAAELAKTHPSRRESLPRSASHDLESSSSEDDSEEEEQIMETKSSSRSKHEPGQQEKNVGSAKISDLEYRQAKSDEVYRSNSGDRREDLFRRSNSEDKQYDEYYRSNSGERREDPFRRSNSDDKQYDEFYRSNSGDRREDPFRRSKSEDKQGGSFRRSNQEGQSDSFSRWNYSEDRPEKDLHPTKRVDSEQETFWRSGDQDWQQVANLRPEKKIDSGGLFSGRSDEHESLYQRDSDLFRASESDNLFAGTPNDKESYARTPKMFSSTDSAANLFRRSNSEELELRSSDETPFYDSNQGFATPKFDEDELPHSKPNSLNADFSMKRDLDNQRSNFDSLGPKSSLDFWRSSSFSRPDEGEGIPRNYSPFGSDDRRLDEQRPGSSNKFDSDLDNSHGLARGTSDPLSSRGYNRGEDAESPKYEDQRQSPIPSKSRRTRRGSKNLEGAGGSGGLPPPPGGRHSKFSSGDNIEFSRSPDDRSPSEPDNPHVHSFDDSPNFPPKTSLSFYNNPPSASAPPERAPPTISGYQPSDAVRDSSPSMGAGSQSSRSSPGLERRDSPSAPPVHPKLPDYDDLTARFEALKGKKKR